MNYSENNTLIIGWNNISDLFISKRLDKSQAYSVIDLEKEHDKKAPLRFFLKENIDTRSNDSIEYIFYFFNKLDKEMLFSLNELCIKKDIKFFIGSNYESVETKHFLDLRSINKIYQKTSFYRKFLLRLFDIIISLLACIIIIPASLILSILIFIDDGFPILFSQQRTGINNKHFSIYKFRSMFNSVDKYGVSPSKNNDQRITKVGNILRKTSLDELPQFLNVLKGEMSIVGPRPEMPFIVENYNEFERFRLKIKPGITGAWQVSPTRNAPIHHNVDYDIYQIINNSLRYNIKQILKTLLWASKGL
jgi:lipopolysaccharide/colanic/teichoic acid biosynthesis glycosyltransferase